MTKIRGFIDRGRIVLVFGYDPVVIRKVKEVPGFSFRKVSRNFAVPLDMTTGRHLRKLFGRDFEPSVELEAWAREQLAKERNLGKLSVADDYELEELRVYRENRPLAESLWPHQRADAKFMAATSCINANQQGTGKTRSVIAANYEAKMEGRPHLIVTHMVSPIESVWASELEHWTTVPILADERDTVRKKQVREAYRLHEQGEPFYLVLNKEMVRYRAEYEEIYDEDRQVYKRVEVGVEPFYPELFNIEWGTITLDEFHELGLSNIKTLGARAFADIVADLRYAMSGTPMQGKPRRLWGALHWLDPVTFSSEWNWINQWLVVEEDFFKHKHVKGIKPGLEDAFYKMLAPYMVRRLKSEVFKGLPPKEYEDVICKMTPAQAEQYTTFAKMAEVRIDELNLTAQGILDEYTRLRIFAAALCRAEGKTVWDWRTREDVEKIKAYATTESGKFPRLLEKLEECGVVPKDDQLGALVFSENRSVVEAAALILEDAGYRVAVLKGGMKENLREIVESFQAAGPEAPQIIAAVTKKGGSTLTMDRADSVHILDEGWVPDITEQAEDRAHRGSRMHRVKVFKYISEGTIEEYVREVGDTKAFLNRDILDLRRQGFRAVKGTS